MRTARLDTSRSELRRRENGVVRNEGALAPGWLRHLVRAPATVAGEGVARDPALGAAHDLETVAGVVGEVVADHVVAHALSLLFPAEADAGAGVPGRDVVPEGGVVAPRGEPGPVGVVAPRAAVALDQVPEGRLLDVDALGGGGDAVVVHPVAVGAVGPAAGLLRGRADVDGLAVLGPPGQVEADPATARDDVAGDLVGLGVALEPDALAAGVVQPVAQQADAPGALHPDEGVGVRELQRLEGHVVVQDLDQPAPGQATGPDQVGPWPPEDPDGGGRAPGTDRAHLLRVPPRADQHGGAGHGGGHGLGDAGTGPGHGAVPGRHRIGGDVQRPRVVAPSEATGGRRGPRATPPALKAARSPR